MVRWSGYSTDDANRLTRRFGMAQESLDAPRTDGVNRCAASILESRVAARGITRWETDADRRCGRSTPGRSADACFVPCTGPPVGSTDSRRTAALASRQRPGCRLRVAEFRAGGGSGAASFGDGSGPRIRTSERARKRRDDKYRESLQEFLRRQRHGLPAVARTQTFQRFSRSEWA